MSQSQPVQSQPDDSLAVIRYLLQNSGFANVALYAEELAPSNPRFYLVAARSWIHEVYRLAYEFGLIPESAKPAKLDVGKMLTAPVELFELPRRGQLPEGARTALDRAIDNYESAMDQGVLGAESELANLYRAMGESERGYGAVKRENPPPDPQFDSPFDVDEPNKIEPFELT